MMMEDANENESLAGAQVHAVGTIYKPAIH
jgi:hypothetical protein